MGQWGMTTPSPLGGRNRMLFPTMPRGEVVATYETYLDAQQAVDVLARADFPVDKVSIVGSDLKSVERVTGKLTWGRVALAGAASGAWLGIFFGLLLLIFSMLFGIVSYAINRRRRDYTSVMQVIATSYSVLVDPDLVNRARNLLGAEPNITPAPGGWAQPQHPSDPPPAPPAAPTGDDGRPPAPPA